MINGYVTLAALKAVLHDPRSVDDEAYERAISAASRRIDDYTGRRFWRTATAEPHLFTAVNRYLVEVGDFADVTAMVVETADPAGVFTTLAGSQWQPEPHARPDGYPYTAVVTPGGVLPVAGMRPRVRVTARWGWESVAAPVEQACQLLATAYYKAPDMVAGSTGFEQDSARLDALTPQVRALLEAYRTDTARAADPPREAT